MSVQTVFKRYELKYKLTRQQHSDLCDYMQDYMKLDSYGRHKISNIYFDTDDYRIIRASLEKPKYKEKLRLRIYGTPNEEKPAFIELKKKFNGVVYKRRISASQNEAISYLFDGKQAEHPSQIHKEIDYFIDSYDNLLMPRVYLSYEREAYYCEEDDNFRMTFDFNIKMRDTNVSLYDDADDTKVLDDDYVLLEVKTVQGLPFWLIEFFNQQNIYKTSFSKYGTAYNTFLLPHILNEQRGLLRHA